MELRLGVVKLLLGLDPTTLRELCGPKVGTMALFRGIKVLGIQAAPGACYEGYAVEKSTRRC